MFTDNEGFGIELEDLADPAKVKMLLHVISTVYPNHLYNRLTEDDINNLEYNQLANRLCFEFCERT